MDSRHISRAVDYWSRIYDEAENFDDRMMKMQRTGKLSFYMRSFGEEAVAIAQTWPWRTMTGYSPPTASQVPNSLEAETWLA